MQLYRVLCARGDRLAKQLAAARDAYYNKQVR